MSHAQGTVLWLILGGVCLQLGLVGSERWRRWREKEPDEWYVAGIAAPPLTGPVWRNRKWDRWNWLRLLLGKGS